MLYLVMALQVYVILGDGLTGLLFGIFTHQLSFNARKWLSDFASSGLTCIRWIDL